MEGPDEGLQHVELDAHCSVSISQIIDTVAGKKYELSYASKERPNTSTQTNGLLVNLNGDEISEISNMSSDWKTKKHKFTATGPTTIEFIDIGTSDSYSTFLDDVKVTLYSDKHND